MDRLSKSHFLKQAGERQMKNKKLHNQSGYSLIEVIVATAFTMIFLAVFTGGIYKLTASNSVTTEAADRNVKTAELVEKLKKWGDEAGRGMTLLSTAPFSGDYRLEFLPSYEWYCLAPGECANYDTPDSSAMVESQISFAANSDFKLSFQHNGAMKLSIENEDGAAFRVNLDQDENANRTTLTTYENNVAKQSYAFNANNNGYVNIRFARSFLNNAPQCQATLTYQPVNGAQVTYNGDILPCGTKDKKIFMSLGYNTEVYNLTASGSNLHKTPQYYSVNMPALPYHSQYFYAPLTATADGFISFSGDEKKYSLGAELDRRTSPDKICFSAADRPLDDLDYSRPYLLLNAVERRSMLFNITNPYKSGDQDCFTLQIISEPGDTRSGSWFGFHTDETQYVGFQKDVTYPVGSKIVHLNPPREIRFNQAESALYERLGLTAPWMLLASNIKDFKVVQISANPAQYEVSFTSLTEGVEAEQTGEAVRFNISPRALNNTFDAR